MASSAEILSRYFHTIRYLRPSQVAYRLARRIWRPLPDLSPAPPRESMRGPWLPPPRKPPSLVAPDRFQFLGREVVVERPTDWNDPRCDALRLFNLHYFDDLVAEGGAERVEWHRSLLRRWIAENPPPSGIGWMPYPTSLRIVNWIKWALEGNDPGAEALASLATQARLLARSLELDTRGNHLLANSVALVFAGTFFAGAEAAAWQREGLELLQSELREQILPDGGHAERSPMYHALVLESILDLVNLRRVFPHRLADSAGWRSCAIRMLRWVRTLTHPDGEIALFNDAAHGVALAPAALEAYARHLDIPAPAWSPSEALLRASGYVRAERGRLTLLLDAGTVGPDHLPAHAHAGTLSFELSIGRARVLVNSGTSEYHDAAIRAYERGTSAHNTIRIGGVDSSEMWAKFRVARRARVVELDWTPAVEDLTIRAAHDGYARLSSPVIHRRTWRIGSDGLTIDDELLGQGSQEAELFLHFHPDVGVALDCDNRFRLTDGDGRALGTLALGSILEVAVEEGAYRPRFGTAHRNLVLVGRWRGMMPARFSCELTLATARG